MLLSSATTMCWPSTTSTSSMVTKGDAVLAAAPGHAGGVLDVERVDVPDFLPNPSASERAMAANKKAGRNPRRVAARDHQIP